MGRPSTQWKYEPAEDFIVQRAGSIDPSKHVNETFDLFSIAAYDSGTPENLLEQTLVQRKVRITRRRFDKQNSPPYPTESGL